MTRLAMIAPTNTARRAKVLLPTIRARRALRTRPRAVNATPAKGPRTSASYSSIGRIGGRLEALGRDSREGLLSRRPACHDAGMDAISEWADAQARVIELTESITRDQADRLVPACPDWTVRELLSHIIGLDADVLAGDEPDDHNSEWTQRQVDARAGRDIAALLQEWRGLTEPLQEWMRVNGTRPMGDVVIHEQDLRGALGVPGARDTEGIAAMRDRFATRFEQLVRAAGLPAIRLQGESWEYTAGDGDPSTVVRASDFDLARAVIARRSARQLRAWTQVGDIEAFLPCFATLGSLPDADLTD
jgi:uncharacterized protein (TIGR03083 family)